MRWSRVSETGSLVSRKRDSVVDGTAVVCALHSRRCLMRNAKEFGFSRRSLLIAAVVTSGPMSVFAQTTPGKSRIGIIGSGKIGSTIGGLWVKAGHPVLFSSRHPEQLKELVTGLGALARKGTVSDAISFGDALLFA